MCRHTTASHSPTLNNEPRRSITQKIQFPDLLVSLWMGANAFLLSESRRLIRASNVSGPTPDRDDTVSRLATYPESTAVE